MISEVYDAFRAAHVPDEQARKAAEAVAVSDARFDRIDARFERIETRLSKLESDMTLLKWMIGTNGALTVAVLLKLLI